MVEPIDTSTLGPIRVDGQVDAARFGRAQDVVERFIDPIAAEFPKAVQAAIEFEQSERKRNG